MDVVHYLVEHSMVNLNTQGSEGNTALHFAMIISDENLSLKMVTYLLEQHANSHIKNNKGNTPLDQLSPTHRHYEKIKHLITEKKQKDNVAFSMSAHNTRFEKHLKPRIKKNQPIRMNLGLETQFISNTFQEKANLSECSNLIGFLNPATCEHGYFNTTREFIPHNLISIPSVLPLIDLLIRKKKGTTLNFFQKDDSISDLDAQAYALNIVTEFEAHLKKIEVKVDFDSIALQTELLKKIKSGQFCDISKVLSSTLENIKRTALQPN